QARPGGHRSRHERILSDRGRRRPPGVSRAAAVRWPQKPSVMTPPFGGEKNALMAPPSRPAAALTLPLSATELVVWKIQPPQMPILRTAPRPAHVWSRGGARLFELVSSFPARMHRARADRWAVAERCCG